MSKKYSIVFAVIILTVMVTGCGKKKASIIKNKIDKNKMTQEEIASGQNKAAADTLELTGDIDLNESGLESPSLPEVNMDLDFSTGDASIDVDPGSGELTVPAPELEAPSVPEIDSFVFDPTGLADSLTPKAPAEETGNPAAPQGTGENTAPPADTMPDAATCAQFSAAPSCDFVPANVQELCRKCK